MYFPPGCQQYGAHLMDKYELFIKYTLSRIRHDPLVRQLCLYTGMQSVCVKM